jgi:cold shock CspA family protein
MATGIIHKLVHFSQQTYQPNSRLIPGHNDKGYGTIDDRGGREVYFSHDAVPGIHGFDNLRRGQTVEYSLEEGPYLRAKSVHQNDLSTAIMRTRENPPRGGER